MDSEDGLTAYAIMIAFFIAVAVESVTLLGQKSSSIFNSAATKISMTSAS